MSYLCHCQSDDGPGFPQVKGRPRDKEGYVVPSKS